MPACWRSAPSRRARAISGACTFRAVARRPTKAAFAELELKAGEFSLHHVGIMHGSEPNISDRRRIGFAGRYMAPQVRRTIAVTDGAMSVRGTDRFNHFELEPSRARPAGWVARPNFSSAVRHSGSPALWSPADIRLLDEE